jgi:hypothetical protein
MLSKGTLSLKGTKIPMAADLSLYYPYELMMLHWIGSQEPPVSSSLINEGGRLLELIGVSSIGKDMWNVICGDPTSYPNLFPYSDDGELAQGCYTKVKTGVLLAELFLLNSFVAPEGEIHRHVRRAIHNLCSVDCEFVLIGVSG